MATMARVLVIPLAVVAVFLVGCGSGHKRAASVPPAGSTSSGTTTATAPSAPTARCATSALAVWIGIGEGGSTAGSTFYPLELTNVSSHASHLFGFPGVSAYSSHQLGSAAQRNHAVPEHSVSLAPGETAHTVLQITDVANFSPSLCAPVTAAELKVIPPDERSAAGVPFSFRACSKTGPIFLTVQPVQPGVGVPGYPSL